MTIEKKTTLIRLFSLYQNLLTDTQRQYFKAYVEDDFSLKDIADAFNVSRSAVHDQIHKIEQHLLNYEEKLHLLEDSEKRLKIIDEYKETNDINVLEKLRKMDE